MVSIGGVRMYPRSSSGSVCRPSQSSGDLLRVTGPTTSDRFTSFTTPQTSRNNLLCDWKWREFKYFWGFIFFLLCKLCLQEIVFREEGLIQNLSNISAVEATHPLHSFSSESQTIIVYLFGDTNVENKSSLNQSVHTCP